PSAKGDDKFITTDYLQQCPFSVPVTPHTFRHSYAMHMLYAGIPLKVLQSLMGHKSISSTEVYTKVFALDVAARHRVQFSMPESDAVSMLKRIP
uniref:tyrosine-type recombinase/integrase n=1 Tax=Escherichia coli TaxID=562 RepID=UPI0013DFCFBF